jgi:putative acetyltransferase
MPLEIRPATSADDVARIAALFQEYADSLDVDLCFQGFAQELASLPGSYAPPGGALLLATDGLESAGCVALHALADGAGEIKRLYVRKDWRGTGLGRRLAEAVIAEGRRVGYAKLRLDTLPSMGSAIALYRTLGFNEIPPYRANPVAGALFLELDLA